RPRSSLIQDQDASPLVMGHVILDRGHPGPPGTLAAGPESLLGEILGPEFYDKVLQLMDAEGRPGARSARLRGEALPLSAKARASAARGARTFETVRRAAGERVRLLTLPIQRDGRLVQLVRVGIPRDRAART